MTERPGPPPSGKIIPLLPGVARSSGDRRVMLREAVLQVVGHLVLRAVPPSRRVPLFDQAMGLLDEAGWGLDELVRAAEPGPAQDELLEALGLLELVTAPAPVPGPSGGDDMRDRGRCHHRMSRALTARAPPFRRVRRAFRRSRAETSSSSDRRGPFSIPAPRERQVRAQARART